MEKSTQKKRDMSNSIENIWKLKILTHFTPPQKKSFTLG